jgi:hypothetical protein
LRVQSRASNARIVFMGMFLRGGPAGPSITIY